jgi:uridine kinase
VEEIKDVILRSIGELLKKKDYLVIAIDGRCGSGKTTLAKSLSESLDCNIIQMDHFFLTPDKRTAERLSEPGGNVEHERFLSDVLMPLKQRSPFSYSAFDCEKQEMTAPIQISQKSIYIIEGAYSCHPKLASHYDLRIFLDIDPQEQARRIKARNGESGYKAFRDKWIPLEELYFEAYGIMEDCDIILHCKICCSDV